MMTMQAINIGIGVVIGVLLMLIVGALSWPPSIEIEAITLDGYPFECVAVAGELVCNAPKDAPQASGATP